jgi:hypothetical protein
MNDRDKHRYRIWELGKESAPNTGPRSVVGVEKRVLQSRERSPAIQAEELTTMMALYDYHPSINAQLQATCEGVTGAPLYCKTTKIAADAVHLVYETKAGQSIEASRKQAESLSEGTGVRLHVEELGSLAGTIAAKKREGFDVRIDSEYRPAIRNGLARMAATYAVAVERGAGAASKISTVEPSIKRCHFLDHTGTLREGTLVNISENDALIRAKIIPPEGSRVVLRGTIQRAADVIRVFEIAFALKFLTSHP